MLGSSLEMGWRFRVEIRMRMGLVRIKGVRIWELITAVLKNEPGVAQFRDTYATILMKQGEHEQAIAEFEKALPGLTDRTTVHQNLASLYRQIGHTAMATEHEKLAEESKKK